MTDDELKHECSPVVLRDEVTRLQAKEQLWYQDVEEREELAKLQLETLDALAAEIKRLHEIIRKYRKTERCMQLAGNLAGALRGVLHTAANRTEGDAALADYDAMMKASNDGK